MRRRALAILLLVATGLVAVGQNVLPAHGRPRERAALQSPLSSARETVQPDAVDTWGVVQPSAGWARMVFLTHHTYDYVYGSGSCVYARHISAWACEYDDGPYRCQVTGWAYDEFLLVPQPDVLAPCSGVLSYPGTDYQYDTLTLQVWCRGGARTGLMHFRARQYDPATGRFLQQDPVLGNRASEHYAYGANNPLSFTDPFGEGPLEQSQYVAWKLYGGPPPAAGSMSDADYYAAQASMKSILQAQCNQRAAALKAEAALRMFVIERNNMLAEMEATSPAAILGTIAQGVLKAQDAVLEPLVGYQTAHDPNFFAALAPLGWEESLLMSATRLGGVTEQSLQRLCNLERAMGQAEEIVSAERTALRGVEAYALAREGEEFITVYRGTSLTSEVEALRRSGHVLSEAARTALLEGATLPEALARSASLHERWVSIWYGSERTFAEAHAAFGTELRTSFGLDRTLVSVTTDPALARWFAGEYGVVLEAQVPRSLLIPQTLKGAGEGEYLLRHGSDLFHLIE